MPTRGARGPGLGPGRGPGAFDGAGLLADAAGACGVGAAGAGLGPGVGAGRSAAGAAGWAGAGPGLGAPGLGAVDGVAEGPGVGRPAAGAAGAAPGLGAPDGLGPGFADERGPGAGDDPPSLAPPSFGANDSRSRRATGASTVDDADLTNSPCSFRRSSTCLLVTPSSLASSCTRALPATALLYWRPSGFNPLRPRSMSGTCSSWGLHGVLMSSATCSGSEEPFLGG